MQQLNSTHNVNTFGPQITEIFESEIVEKYNRHTNGLTPPL